MSIETALRIGIVVFVIAAGWWVVKHPNRSRTHPSRVRLPKLIPIVGWALIVAGLLAEAFTFAVSNPELGMHITAIAMIVGGGVLVLMYRSFYVAAEAEVVHFRTLLGREKAIVYDQISEVSRYQMNGKSYVKVVANDGTTLNLDEQMYDLSPMLQHLQLRGITPR